VIGAAMTFEPDSKATLASFDEREAEIARSLPHLKKTLPSREYARIEVVYTRELKQIEVRRQILQAIEREELIRDIRAAFSARGILITGDKR